MADRSQVAHVLRRAGFGPTAAEVDAAAAGDLRQLVTDLITPTGLDLGAIASPLPTATGDPFLLPENAQRTPEQQAQDQQTKQTQLDALAKAWLRRMAMARNQLTEKMVFFWHGHWATSAEKVDSATLMRHQLETFRGFGRGYFPAFAKQMVRDPALIFWLDGQLNSRRAPNENLGRELMELFTLGIGAYQEPDVKAAAKALTGWTIDRTRATSKFVPNRFFKGTKRLLSVSADFDANLLVDLLCTRQQHAPFLAARLWRRFGSTEQIPDSTRKAMVDAYALTMETDAMLRAMFTDEKFMASQGQLVKQPIEWIVGAVRQLGTMMPDDVLDLLDDMGQEPLRPPSVGGWPSGAAWLTTSLLQVRMYAASSLAAKLPTKTAALLKGSTPSKLEALAHVLAIDAWSDRTYKALSAAAGKQQRLVTLALCSPEYTIT
ncbi:DUF1800 domain-containing protein [Hamadaea tsunoensis]|uniref:DUF1800 domain-containing protein n=1 Tax=Hamadaea tsunoensis TaxID=53368 RepID=UPI00047FE858|nr:DUF1800 family protein [Hamadaea tsunoensis]